MPQFVELPWQEFASHVLRVQQATLNNSIPWEDPVHYAHRGLAKTAYDADCHALLGCMLNPEQFPPITGAWLVNRGFEMMLIPVTESIYYRLTLPVMDEAHDIAESGTAHGYLELASDDASNNGWFVMFRTCNGEQSNTAALLTCRKVYTQADVMMLLFILGVWPGALPHINHELENLDVVTQPSAEGDSNENSEPGVVDPAWFSESNASFPGP